MSGGFRSRQRAGKRDETEVVLVEEGGVRVTSEAVVTERRDYALDQVVSARRRSDRPLWGPLVLSVLATINLVAGFQPGALRDFAAAAVMLGGGALWWKLGARHTLVLNVGGREEDVWLTRDGKLMERVLAAVEARIEAKGDP